MMTPRNVALASTLSIVALVAAMTSGCIRSSGGPPQVLTFNYRILAGEDPALLAAALGNGSVSISDKIGPAPCRFTASFTANEPELAVGGVPGDTGYNLAITGAQVVNASTTNSASCATIRDLHIAIGTISERLVLRQTATRSFGDLLLTDGRRLKESVFFRAVIDSHDLATERVTGQFRFASNEALGSTTILLAEGSFGMR